MEIEEAVSVEIESCLKTLPDDFLNKWSDQSLGNLLLFDKTSKINLITFWCFSYFSYIIFSRNFK